MAVRFPRSAPRRGNRPERPVALALFFLSVLAAGAPIAAARPHLPPIAGIGHIYVGGQEAEDPVSGARIESGQTYVQVIRLARPRNPVPVLLLPGGSLSGAVYETTPDGRPGWLTDFLAAGYSVMVADTGHTGRSPSAPSGFRSAPAAIRGKTFLWETFRIGPPGSWDAVPARRRAYPRSRFPLAAFDTFVRQVFPRYRPPIAVEVARYTALLDRLCPCIIVAHSAAGPLVERAAVVRPGKVAALLLVEPSGGIALSLAQAERLSSVPHLFLWGDFLDQPGWPEQYRTAAEDRAALARAGGLAETIDLPAIGIGGNSHMLMLDDNSSAVAALMLRWLDRNLGAQSAPARRRVQQSSSKRSPR